MDKIGGAGEVTIGVRQAPSGETDSFATKARAVTVAHTCDQGDDRGLPGWGCDAD